MNKRGEIALLQPGKLLVKLHPNKLTKPPRSPTHGVTQALKTLLTAQRPFWLFVRRERRSESPRAHGWSSLGLVG